MRALLLGILVYFSSGMAYAQKNIRDVDFKNFTYPLSGPLLGHGELKWLGQPKDGNSNNPPIHLKNGEDREEVSSFMMDGHKLAQYAGFTLQSVEYSDVTGEGQEQAIVVLRYDTGGTQNTHYVYIYGFADGKPKLLAYCHTGSRAYHGLYKVYGEGGRLVFELLDPVKSIGECCSTRFVRTRYRRNKDRFEADGAPKYGQVQLKKP